MTCIERSSSVTHQAPRILFLSARLFSRCMSQRLYWGMKKKKPKHLRVFLLKRKFPSAYCFRDTDFLKSSHGPQVENTCSREWMYCETSCGIRKKKITSVLPSHTHAHTERDRQRERIIQALLCKHTGKLANSFENHKPSAFSFLFPVLLHALPSSTLRVRTWLGTGLLKARGQSCS